MRGGPLGGSHEAVLDGETGFVIDPHDVTASRPGCAGCSTIPALRTRLGAAARAWAESECSYDRRVEPLARLAAGDLGVLRTTG